MDDIVVCPDAVTSPKVTTPPPLELIVRALSVSILAFSVTIIAVFIIPSDELFANYAVRGKYLQEVR